MAPHEIEILKVQKLPSANLARPGQIETVVFFLRDKDNTDSIIIPEDTNDPAKIEAAIKKELKSRDDLTGKKFQV